MNKKQMQALSDAIDDQITHANIRLAMINDDIHTLEVFTNMLKLSVKNITGEIKECRQLAVNLREMLRLEDQELQR